MAYGTVYWITGLSGSGKTTIGRLLYERLKRQKPEVVFLDGDMLRQVFGDDLGHTLEDRRKSAMRNSGICKLLADQGLDVVCATISMFNSCRQWNRENIPNYREIYIHVPMDVLIERDPDGLYSRALRGEIKNVWGIDLQAEEPESPDIIISYDSEQKAEQVAERLLRALTPMNVE